MTAPTLSMLGPALTVTTWLVVALVLIVLAVVTILCVVRARRLDRLHRRTDAARAGLADALERRGTVAVRVADAVEHRAAAARRGHMTLFGSGPEPPHGPVMSLGSGPQPRPVSPRPEEPRALRAAAHEALAACRTGARSAGAGFEVCEVAENTLTRRLEAVDRAALPTLLAGELVDAEQLVLLARRVYNDAVRDTVDLRSRRLVRWLRLAGTAPAPAYFEIADPPRREVPAAAATGAASAGPDTGALTTGTVTG
jgi:hypothetical protein